MLHRDGQQERRLDFLVEYFEESSVIPRVIGLGDGDGRTDGLFVVQPTRHAVEEIVHAVGLVERVQSVHRVKERVISNESSLVRGLRAF